MNKFVEFFIKNSLIVNLASVALIVAGIMFMAMSQREAFPKVDFGYVIIQTVYPGATASDVEKLISKPIEDELNEVSTGVKRIYSSSSENVSVVAVELEADIENKSKTIQDIQSAVDGVKGLPADAEDPVVTELNTSVFPVIRISMISSKGIENYDDEERMREYVKRLKDKIINLKGVAKIETIGYRDKEMHVEVDLDKLDEYHVALNDISSALSYKNVNFPGGTARENGEDVLIRTIGEFETTGEVADTAIRANDIGQLVRVGDVADVKETFEKEEIINKTNGLKSITLTVMIKENYDIIRLVDSVRKEIGEFEEAIPEHYSLVLTDDFSYYVKRRLNVLVGNGIVGLALVVLTLFLALGWRISLVTAAGLPIAFAGTFWMMGLQGVSINLMSMFGLIMVLGMLVDDAIIVAENIYRHLEHGQRLDKAVVLGTTEVMIPVAGTIMTTIAAFAPMMFMGGIMGKFMWALPAVVSIALTMSWLESMLILPSHIFDIEKIFRKEKDGDTAQESATLKKSAKKSRAKAPVKAEHVVKHSPFKVRLRYVKLLSVVLQNRLKFLAGLTLFFILTGIFAVKVIKFELFPGGGIEQMVVLAEAPTGTSLEEMEKKIAAMEKAIGALPDDYVESYISRTGIMAEDESDPDTKTGSKYGSILINLTPFQQRKKLSKDADAQAILDRLREETKGIQKGFSKITFKMIENGPPEGTDVSVNIKGEDFATLKEIGDKYRAYLATIDGLEDIKDSFEEEKKEFRVYVNQAIAVRAGISAYDVASTIRTYYEGSVATEIKKSEEEIKVRVILPKAERDDLEQLKQISVANRQGALIPLDQVATFKRTSGISVINRDARRRNLVVTAGISDNAKNLSAIKVNLKLQKEFADIEKEYPGYVVSYEGQFEDIKDSFVRLGRSYLIAVLLIYIILVALFQDLRQPLIVLSIIPFTMCGVVWSFFVHGLPLSFMSLMGIVGLAGVVVNDSIVYVDFINKARQRGKDAYEASLEAGYKRIRPIILTTVTTVAGLLPTAYGIGGSDPFLVPMAVAMAYGLLFGLLVTLLGTPAIYNFYYPKSCLAGMRACKDPLENITKWEEEDYED